MLTDANLWESIKIGDEKAFTLLFHRYSSLLYSRSYSYVRDRGVCEQIVHDIFLTVWTNRSKLDINNFKAYFTSAARYRVYKHLIASKVNQVEYKEDLTDLEDRANKVENFGYNQIVYENLEGKLEAYLENLPKRCKEIFLMSRIQLLSNEEISQQLGISKRTVENQITYALKYLRISFKDIYVLVIIMASIRHWV